MEGELGGVEVGERSVEEYVFQEFRHEQHSSLEENEWSEKLNEDGDNIKFKLDSALLEIFCAAKRFIGC